MASTTNGELCHAHSGIVARITIGGCIIGGLMVIFCSLLGIMWNELRNQNNVIMSKIDCLASDEEMKEFKLRVDRVREKQIEIDTRLGTIEKRTR